jgi:FkbM family methyltransferase
MILSYLLRKLVPSIPLTKVIWGMEVWCDLRDNALWWARKASKIEQDEPFYKLLDQPPCLVWDIGCNIGVFSILATRKYHRVIAFDISPKACWLLKNTAEMNNLDIDVRCYALSCREWSYTPPTSSHTEEHITSTIGYRKAVCWKVLTEIPGIIKMDIQGAEKEFLEDRDFKQWIIENKILFLCEIHETIDPWPEMVKLDHCHYIMNYK